MDEQAEAVDALATQTSSFSDTVIAVALAVLAVVALLAYRRWRQQLREETRPRFTLRDLLRVAARRRWSLCIPALLGLLFAPTAMLAPPTYTARALIRREDSSLVRNAPSSLLAPSDVTVSIDNVREEILTWPNLKQVIVQTKLDAGLRTNSDWQEMYEKLAKAIRIRAVAQSRGVDLIEIEVMHEDPSLAEKIANYIADNYVEDSRRSGRDKSHEAVEFYQRGADDYLAKLRATELELEQYTETHFQELPEVKHSILNRMLSLQTDVTAKAIQLTEAQGQLYELEHQMVDVPRTIQDETTDASGEAVPNPVYQQLEAHRLTLRQQIGAYAAAMESLNAELQSNQKAVRSVVDEDRRYSDLIRMRDQYERTYDEFYRALVPARKSLEVRANEDAYGTNVRLLVPALEPTIPNERGYLAVAGCYALAGILAGVVLAAVRERWDMSLRDAAQAALFRIPVLGSIPAFLTLRQVWARRARRAAIFATVLLVITVGGSVAFLADQGAPFQARDVTRTAAMLAMAMLLFLRTPFGWPAMGLLAFALAAGRRARPIALPGLPVGADASPSGPGTVMVHDHSGKPARGFRFLRERLLSMKQGGGPRTIAVTSAWPGEGKTTVALNLAIALAETDSGRVVLVDGDLWAPSVQAMTGIDADTGMNEILTNDLELEGNVYETAIARLDVVPAMFSDAPLVYARPLAQHGGDLIEKLREHYSFVVIDTPPVFATTDACLWARQSDGVLMVIRRDRTPVHVATGAVDTITACGGSLLGTVLTFS